MPLHAGLAQLVDVDRLVVAALQLLDDALLQVAGLLGGVGLARAETHDVLAVQVPADEVAPEEAEGHEKDDDDGAQGAHQRR